MTTDDDNADLFKLSMFASRVLEIASDRNDEELLEQAMLCGLVTEQEMTVPCGDECACVAEAQLGECVRCWRVQPVTLRALARDDFNGELNG